MNHHRPIRQSWESAILAALTVALAAGLFLLTVAALVDAYWP